MWWSGQAQSPTNRGQLCSVHLRGNREMIWVCLCEYLSYENLQWNPSQAAQQLRHYKKSLSVSENAVYFYLSPGFAIRY